MTLREMIINAPTLLNNCFRWFTDTAPATLTATFLVNGEEVTYSRPNAVSSEKKIDDFIAGSNYFSFNATQANIEAELNKAPNGAKITVNLTEDIDWDFNYTRDNISIYINLLGHSLNLKEDDYTGIPFVYGINGTGCNVSISGNNRTDSKVVLPVRTLDTTETSHGAFLFSGNYGWTDSNSLTLGYGLTVVDNDNFFLMATKAGSSFSISSVSLESASRGWKNLIYGMQIVNGVAKNFSTNISLV